MIKYFLIGERHGTNECPKEFFNFVKKHKIKKVALELPKIYQNEMDSFLKNKISVEKLSLFKNKEQKHDGRVSEAVKKLIINLKKEKIKIFLVDEEKAKNGNERDKLMARNLKKIKGKVAFLCGEIHASKRTIQLEKTNYFYSSYPNGKIKTCASFLNKREISTGLIFPRKGGRFYNNSIKKYSGNLKKYREKFDFILFVDKFSYSK